MVRLVFRPYTHVGRTICTSVPLRASTRVSPGFTLRRHSSPSFGSRRACSRSNPTTEGDRPTVLPCGFPPARSRFAWGFVTLPLACASDSLVRVSRRVERDRYARVPNVLGPPPRPKGDGDRPPEGARWFPRPDAPFRRSASAGTNPARPRSSSLR